MATVILTEKAPDKALESILRRTAYSLIPFCIVLIKYVPEFGVLYGRYSGGLMWVGVATQKNSLGVLCLVSVFFCFWALLRGWKDQQSGSKGLQKYGDALVALIGLYLLKGPSNAGASKTSLVVLAVGTSLLLALREMRKRGRFLDRRFFVILMTLAYCYGLGVPFGLTSLFAGLVQALGRDTTFTGRTEIWEELIPIAMNSPILGCGYGGFWVKPVETGVNEAHNGYIDVLLEQGIVGLLLLFHFVISVCRTSYKVLPSRFWWASFGLSFLLMSVFHNASESTFLKTSDFFWTILVFVSMVVSNKYTDTYQQKTQVQMRDWRG
ncbi:MAG TPA: O-antigen ligase family protein [Verrucomicrobiae bacterium]|nr:O-antigen ligase family protein [Verrucomicrobiae bacterium]